MIAWFATKGSGTNEAARIEALLGRFPEKVELPFDKSAKRQSFFRLWQRLRELRPRLLVMEGSGIAGGLACLGARLFLGIPYVVSSGDAIGPFVRAHHPAVGLLFEIYERLLCRFCAGFIGWTPYLCGRAMAFGAPRAVTAQGWVLGSQGNESNASPECRAAMRGEWGIPLEKRVVGLVGALEWNPHRNWCYGLDLVRAMKRLRRTDLCVLIVGGGSGLERLRAEAGDALGRSVFLPGPVPLERVLPALAAMDLASLPQSVDGVGSYRYTTKLPEYAAARLPVITNQVPMAYDLGGEWMWRLPGNAPWEERHIAALVELLESLDEPALEAKRRAIPDLRTLFDRETQIARVGAFLADLLDPPHPHSPA